MNAGEPDSAVCGAGEADPPSSPSVRRLRLLAAALSGILLASAYPGVGISELAWIAFVPLTLAVRGLSAGRAFRLGWIAGLVFFLGSMYWLWRVTIMGLVALSAYCGLYFGFFAAFLAFWDRRVGMNTAKRGSALVLAGAGVWAGLEMLRSHLFTGFAWNTLAISQWQATHIIQIAEYTGVYGVSFVVMSMNLAVASTLARYHGWIRHRRKVRMHLEIMVAMLFVLLPASIASGFLLRGIRPGADTVRVLCVQPNIPQYEKWNGEFVARIRNTLTSLTSSWVNSGFSESLDLVVWPETSIPDEFRYSRESQEMVLDLASKGVPILVGTIDFAKSVSPEGVVSVKWYNSSMLVHGDGRKPSRYDKRHLVVGGEYFPGWQWLPASWARTYSPLGTNFSPGDSPAVIRDIPKAPIGVLICFEDTIPGLARESVLAGARLLVNQTNDAWFEPSRASWQHAAHGVFRSVETRVPTLRVANSGVSCVITPDGRIARDLILDMPPGSRQVRVEISKPLEVAVPGPDFQPTFHTRNGDVFGLLCAIPASLWVLLFLTRRFHRMA